VDAEAGEGRRFPTVSKERPMRFMIIVKATSDSEAGRFPPNPEPLFQAMATFHEELARAGALLDASGLQTSSKGWRVQYDGGKRTVVDGPFTESKELVAGYTLIQTRTRDEAIEWSKRFPNPIGEGVSCHIEVRQLYEMEDFDGIVQEETKQRFEKIDIR
jgi:hypothetical protein